MGESPSGTSSPFDPSAGARQSMAGARVHRERADEATRAAISRSSVRAMRQFLHAYREGWLLEARLAAAARMAADDAHRQGLLPEQMLVALKDAWATLDEVRRLPPLDEPALRSRLVTLSISAYYRPDSAERQATHPEQHVSARTAA